MAHALLIEVLLLNQRQVRIAFHLGHGQVTSNVFFRRSVVDFALIDGPCTTHVTEVTLIIELPLRHVLALGELLEGSLIVIHHVTVVRKVRIMGTSLVLQRLDWRCKVYFALEEFLGGDLVELLRMFAHWDRYFVASVGATN